MTANANLALRYAPLEFVDSLAFAGFLSAQFRLDKAVDVAIHHGLHVARLRAGAVVFHHLIWLKHVRSNLISPSNLAFLAVLPLYLCAFFVFFELIKFRFQHFHRQFAIPSLAALGLTSDDDSTWFVQDAHCSLDLVHVLAAFSAAPKRADLEIG